MGCGSSSELQGKLENLEKELARQKAENAKYKHELEEAQREKERLLAMETNTSQKIRTLGQKLAQVQHFLPQEAEPHSSSSSDS